VSLILIAPALSNSDCPPIYHTRCHRYCRAASRVQRLRSSSPLRLLLLLLLVEDALRRGRCSCRRWRYGRRRGGQSRGSSAEPSSVSAAAATWLRRAATYRRLADTHRLPVLPVGIVRRMILQSIRLQPDSLEMTMKTLIAGDGLRRQFPIRCHQFF